MHFIVPPPPPSLGIGLGGGSKEGNETNADHPFWGLLSKCCATQGKKPLIEGEKIRKKKTEGISAETKKRKE